MNAILFSVFLALSTCSILLKDLLIYSRHVPSKQSRMLRSNAGRIQVGNFAQELIFNEPIIKSISTGDIAKCRKIWPQASKNLEKQVRFMRHMMHSFKFSTFLDDRWFLDNIKAARKIGIPEKTIEKSVVPYIKRIQEFGTENRGSFPDIYTAVHDDYERDYLAVMFRNLSFIWNKSSESERIQFRAGLDAEFRSRIIPQAATAYIISQVVDKSFFLKDTSDFSLIGDVFESLIGEFDSDIDQFSFKEIEERLITKLNWRVDGSGSEYLVRAIRETAKVVEEICSDNIRYNTEIE